MSDPGVEKFGTGIFALLIEDSRRQPFGDGSPFCPTTANGPFLFNANLRPYDVSRKISSVFGETKIPLTDKLDLSVSERLFVDVSPTLAVEPAFEGRPCGACWGGRSRPACPSAADQRRSNTTAS